MTEGSRAVFLSYASQDAEAAKKICDALRAAGVEVWFDQSELVGGDAWDQKIRGQIGSCALFVPVISTNTQARLEGYFRREWKQAAVRTHDMADEKAFLLPVVIDDTRDGDALVPAEFKAVQWTRLPGGEPTPAFVARVQKLLGGTAAGVADPGRPGPAKPATPRPALPRKRRAWHLPVIGGAVVAVLALALTRPWEKPRPSASGVPPAAAPASLTEAQKLTRQARALIEDPMDVRENYFLADELAQRAVKADPTDGEAWAVAGRVSVTLVRRNFDTSAARREMARMQVGRAQSLAPNSTETAFASALLQNLTGEPAAAERMLLELTEQAPADWRVWMAIGDGRLRADQVDEALEAYRRASALSGGDSRPLCGEAAIAISRLRLADAEQIYARALAGNPGRAAYFRRFLMLSNYVFDVPAAKAFLERIPVPIRQEDAMISTAAEFFLRTGEGDRALAELQRMPRDFFEDGWDFRPKGYLAGYAHQIAGRPSAAQAEWKQALAAVEKRLAAEPSHQGFMYWRHLLQALTGQVEAAREGRKVLNELTGARSGPGHVWFDAILLVACGEREAAIQSLVDSWPRLEIPLRTDLWGDFLFSPWFAAIREDPRIRTMALEHKAAIDRALRPAAAAAAPAPAPGDKSVAVLAFANLSDDKANEYFSDGISEELLNQLGKVPGLRVAGQNSSFSFKGRNLPEAEIARKLGVAYIVNGSVQRAGTQVRITARLINAADGFQAWSDRFTRDLKDIFAVQDEIAGLIAQNLQLKLAATGRAGRVVDPEAYRLVLEGRQFWNLRTEEGFTKAEAAFTRALAIDPRFAEARAGLAGVCVIRSVYRELDGLKASPADIERAETEGGLALEYDPASAEAHAALGYVHLLANRLEASDRHFQRALSLSPNSALVHCWYALLLAAQGRLDASLRQYQTAAELDPLWFINLQLLGTTHAFARRFDEALAVVERAAALRTDLFVPSAGERARALLALGRKEEAFAAARAVLAQPDTRPRWSSDAIAIRVLWEGGRRAEAEAEAARLLARWPQDNYLRGFTLVALDRFDDALPFLTHTPALMARNIYWDLMWDPWREDPRFARLLATIGRAGEYRVARETLAQMLRDREGRP